MQVFQWVSVMLSVVIICVSFHNAFRLKRMDFIDFPFNSRMRNTLMFRNLMTLFLCLVYLKLCVDGFYYHYGAHGFWVLLFNYILTLILFIDAYVIKIYIDINSKLGRIKPKCTGDVL